MSKYGNERTEIAGRSFSSKLEAAVYQLLRYRELAGEILVLQAQDHVYLTEAEIEYIPDFKCFDQKTKEIFWAEAKGYEDPKWPIKKRLWRFYGPGKLEIYKGTHSRPSLVETIVPKARKQPVNPDMHSTP